MLAIAFYAVTAAIFARPLGSVLSAGTDPVEVLAAGPDADGALLRVRCPASMARSARGVCCWISLDGRSWDTRFE